LREGTDWFRLPKDAFKNYPKGAKIPKGPFRLRPSAELDILRNEFKNKVRPAFIEEWLKKNPHQAWGSDWRVHHIHPLKWGGPNEASNFEILKPGLHNELTSFWNKLMYRIARIGTGR
jgi:hypothetical protein